MRVAYVESSAVLSWLLGEPEQHAVATELAEAERLVTSALTVVECRRGIARARETRRKQPAEADSAVRLLDELAASWSVMDISARITERACGRFPLESHRTLDALHLATAQVFLETFGALRVVSLDHRVRDNARAMGMTVVPPSEEADDLAAFAGRVREPLIPFKAVVRRPKKRGKL